MKPAPFVYRVPVDLEDAVTTLGEHGGDAKVLAGGQSLVPLMNLRMARPSVLVDVCRLSGLADVTVNGRLAIGATARQRTVRESPLVAGAWPVLTEALSHVGHAATRARGTFGGSIAHADPAAEIPAMLLALGGEVVARGVDGERTIPADDFFVARFTTELAEDEVLTEARLPLPVSGTVAGFSEVMRRRGDFALAGVVVVARIDGSGRMQSPRVVLFGIDEVPLRAAATEALISGQELTEELIGEAAHCAAGEIDPGNDVQGSAEYRRELAQARVAHVLRDLTTQEVVTA